MECNICFLNFDHGIHKPYVLIPCTHTICFECLTKIRDPICPFCSCIFTNKNTNWALINMLDYFNQRLLDAEQAKIVGIMEPAREKVGLKVRLGDIKREIMELSEDLRKIHKTLFDKLTPINEKIKTLTAEGYEIVENAVKARNTIKEGKCVICKYIYPRDKSVRFECREPWNTWDIKKWTIELCPSMVCTPCARNSKKCPSCKKGLYEDRYISDAFY